MTLSCSSSISRNSNLDWLLILNRSEINKDLNLNPIFFFCVYVWLIFKSWLFKYKRDFCVISFRTNDKVPNDATRKHLSDRKLHALLLFQRNGQKIFFHVKLFVVLITRKCHLWKAFKIWLSLVHGWTVWGRL